MKVVISHPTGNRNVRAALQGFLDEGILSTFYTSITTFDESYLNKLSKMPGFSELRRRNFDISLKPYTISHPMMEVGRLFASKVGLSKLIKHEDGFFSIDAVYRNLDLTVASDLKKIINRQVDAIYAYEDGALHSFKQAKALGVICLYDLPIGYWRSARLLLEKEKERWPEWISTLTSFMDSDAKLLRKDEELSLADHIFVASSFTAKTLANFPGNLPPIHVIPYGFPAVEKKKDYSLGSKPLKLLFVGSLSQRKGIANLFAAVEEFGKHVQLTIIGLKTNNHCAALNMALRKHNWIPSLPHDSILTLMHEHDVLVFPSLFEGFGLVITEAMSQGTPVITTERTAGPDIIKHGENGWLIEAGSTELLINAIENLVARPKRVGEAGKQAAETARQRPWKVYGKELAKVVQTFNNNKNSDI